MGSKLIFREGAAQKIRVGGSLWEKGAAQTLYLYYFAGSYGARWRRLCLSNHQH